MSEPHLSSRLTTLSLRHPRLLSACGYLLLLLIGTLAYANTFDATLNFDDTAVLSTNGFAPFRGPHFFLTLAQGWRSVGDLTFALNYQLHGLDVFGYHLVNLAVHLATACLVARLVIVTLRTPWCRRNLSSPAQEEELSRWARVIAFFAALLFVVHPVQTQAVTYIVQRYTSLATFFYLGTVLLYAQARLVATGEKRWRRPASLALILLALFSALLAMKTKQIAFTLPFMVLLYEVTFFAGSVRTRAAFLATFLATSIIIPLTIISPSRFSPELFERLAYLPKENPLLSRADYLCTQFRVVVTYIRLLFVPVGQRLDYDYPVYHTFWTAPVLLSFLGLLFLLLLALWFTVSRGRVVAGNPVTASLFRLAGFGIFWFFIALSVESSIIPISDIIVEHRLYLPSVGAFIALVTSGILIARRLGQKRPRAVAATCALLLAVAALLAVATFQRNRVWATEASLWEDTVAKSPNLSRPLNNLATVYIRQNKPLQALPLLLRANALAPGYTDTWLNICIALDKLGTYGDRFRFGKEMVDERGVVKPQHLTEWFSLASNNLGLAYDAVGDHSTSIGHYRKALRLAPNLPEAHFNLGLALLAGGDEVQAVEELRIVAALDPGMARKMLLWFRGRKEGSR